MSDRVAILGAGKMGEALLSGMVRAGRPTSDLVVTTHESGRADTLRERYGVEISDNTTAVKSARTVVIAVKPQDMAALLDDIATLLTVDQLVVSVAAGITTSFIERRVPVDIPVIRVMSNTPVLVDEAMSALSAGSHATEAHLSLAEGLLKPVGRTLRDGAVGQRACVLLLPGRGDDRCRHPARPTTLGRARSDRADRDRQRGDAARLGRVATGPARGGDVAGRNDDRRDPRDGGPQGAGSVSRGFGSGP
jgi:hypothetical protein